MEISIGLLLLYAAKKRTKKNILIILVLSLIGRLTIIAEKGRFGYNI